MTEWPVQASIAHRVLKKTWRQPRATITWCRDSTAESRSCAPEATPFCGEVANPASCLVCRTTPICGAHIGSAHALRTRIPIDSWKTLRRFRPDDPPAGSVVIARLVVCYPPDTSKAELSCGFKAATCAGPSSCCPLCGFSFCAYHVPKHRRKAVAEFVLWKKLCDDLARQLNQIAEGKRRLLRLRWSKPPRRVQ